MQTCNNNFAEEQVPVREVVVPGTHVGYRDGLCELEHVTKVGSRRVVEQVVEIISIAENLEI